MAPVVDGMLDRKVPQASEVSPEGLLTTTNRSKTAFPIQPCHLLLDLRVAGVELDS